MFIRSYVVCLLFMLLLVYVVYVLLCLALFIVSFVCIVYYALLFVVFCQFGFMYFRSGSRPSSKFTVPQRVPNLKSVGGP